MANWGEAGAGALSGAATGAEVGSMFGPGPGTAIGAAAGGLIGGLSGLFGGGDNAMPPPPNPYAAQQTAAINEELNSHVGKDTAAYTGGQIRNEANKAQSALASNPNFTGNASVQAAGANQIQRQAETSMIGANLSGAKMDQDTRHAGLTASMDQNKFDWDTWKAQQDYLHQPSALSSIFTSSLGSFAGSAGAAAGKNLFGGGDTPGGTNTGYSGSGTVNLPGYTPPPGALSPIGP